VARIALGATVAPQYCVRTIAIRARDADDYYTPALYSHAESVCLSLCLSARVSQISRVQTSPNLQCVLSANCVRGSVLMWPHCNMLCAPGFVDNVMFSHRDNYIKTLRRLQNRKYI